MNKRTVGVIATIASALLCGCPGLASFALGAFIALGNQLPQTVQSTVTPQDALMTTVIFLCAGATLVVIPVVVGFLTLRRKTPAAAAPVSPVQPAAPQPPALPARPAPPAPPAAPAAASSMSAPGSEAVYTRLMALNRPSAPYRIVDGRSENVDLIAEWKIVDAQWYEIFAKANLTKVFRIYMKFDPARRELRAMDREYTLQWRAGVPSLSVEASFFKGQKTSVSFGAGYAFTENLAPGQVYKYKFNTNELKQPIQEAVAACGWTYKGVAFGKL